jgi:predicted acetyltransferase
MVVDFQLIKAQPEHKQVMENLMQLYIYDFTEFLDFDVQDNGLFEAYPYLDNYWKETNHRFPYLIMQDKRIIGFVLVRFMASEKRQYYSVAEFFVMKKYRRTGIGTAVAKAILGLHKGQWAIFQSVNNVPAQVFWRKVIADVTKGQFSERIEFGRTFQDFET